MAGIGLFHTFSDSFAAAASFETAITAASNNGSSANCLGYRRAAAIFYSSPSGTGTTSDCKLQESADNSTWADVSSASFTQATTAGGAQIQLMNIDLAKRKQYLRLVHTGAGGSAAGVAAGLFILGENQYDAVSNSPTPVTV